MIQIHNNPLVVVGARIKSANKLHKVRGIFSSPARNLRANPCHQAFWRTQIVQLAVIDIIGGFKVHQTTVSGVEIIKTVGKSRVATKADLCGHRG